MTTISDSRIETYGSPIGFWSDASERNPGISVTRYAVRRMETPGAAALPTSYPMGFRETFLHHRPAPCIAAVPVRVITLSFKPVCRSLLQKGIMEDDISGVISCLRGGDHGERGAAVAGVPRHATLPRRVFQQDKVPEATAMPPTPVNNPGRLGLQIQGC
jgi:hypothetical protein